MEKQDVDRNIKLYYWHISLSEPLFWGPILVLAITQLGKMSLPEIYFMEAVVLLGALFLEIPSGALADKIGRKKTVCIGVVLLCIDNVWFANMQGPLDVWGANIVWVLGHVMCSGANRALMYDTLLSVGREHEYNRIEGGAFANKMLLAAMASLVTGILAGYNLRLPIFLCIPGIVLSGVLVALMREPVIHCVRELRYTEIMKLSVLFVANHKALKWIVLFSALIEVTSKLWFFTYNPYFVLVDLDIRMYGVLFFLLNMIAWFFSKHAHVVQSRVGIFWSIVIMVFCIGVPVLWMGIFVSVFSVSMVLFQNITRGLSHPFFSDFINKHIESEHRATVLSVHAAFVGLAQFIALGVFGKLTDMYTLPTCLALLAIFVLVFGTIGVYKYTKL
jgi:MFS family permease